jgi:hypothetical protein
MVAMLRRISIIAIALVLGACATPSIKLAALKAKSDPQVSEELQCMTDCLEDGSEDCEDCVSQCLRGGSGDSVASRD